MSVALPNLDLRPDHWAIVRDALRRHVPDREVLAFGSRATWTAKDYSDLDLAVMGEEPLSLRVTSALDEAFVESDLPFRVDIVDWARIDDSFRRIVRLHGIAVQGAGGSVKASVSVRATSAKPRDSATNRDRKSRAGTVPLEGLAHVIMGQSPAGSTVGRANGTPLINGPTEFGPHHPKPVQYTSDPRKLAQPGDLLFCVRGATAGRMNWADQQYAIGRGIAAIRHRTDHNLQPFLRAAISSELPFLLAATTGSVFRNVSASQLKELRVPDLLMNQQRAIAHVLGTLDDKIELNRRMNGTLEAMAGALFKSWFVDFDPVRAKMEGRDTGLPQDIADLFPDRMVDSGKGEIPEGWEVVPLDGIARFQNGLALQKFRPAGNEARLPVVKIAQMRAGEANSGEWASAAIKPECIIEDGDVLFSWSGSLLIMMWCGGRAALNQHLFRVTSDRYPKWFYLHSLLSHLPAFRQIAQDKATTMGHIRRHHLTEALCVSPRDGVIAELSDVFSCLLDRQLATELSSRTLAALRDTLLPKLISGEIRVPGAEKLVESVP